MLITVNVIVIAGRHMRGRRRLARAVVGHAVRAARRASARVRRALVPVRADAAGGAGARARRRARVARRARAAPAPRRAASLLTTADRGPTRAPRRGGRVLRYRLIWIPSYKLRWENNE